MGVVQGKGKEGIRDRDGEQGRLTDGIVDRSGMNVSVEQERDKIRKVHTRLRDERERGKKHTGSRLWTRCCWG
jgi:hypothetical protein